MVRLPFFIDFNKTLLSWDADTAAPLPKSGKNSTGGSSNLGRSSFLVGGKI